MTDEQESGNLQGVGYKRPPKDTQFGGKRANPQQRGSKPKTFVQLRKLAQKIASEEIPNADGDTVTRIEALLKVMSSSRNPADRKTFLEYAFGKVKDEVDVTTGGEKIKGFAIVNPDDWDKSE